MTSLQRNGLQACTTDHVARRVTIQAEIGRTIDLLLIAMDPAVLALTDAERVRELAVTFGELASAKHVRDQHELLIHLAARLQAWLKTIAREQAAS